MVMTHVGEACLCSIENCNTLIEYENISDGCENDHLVWPADRSFVLEGQYTRFFIYIHKNYYL